MSFNDEFSDTSFDESGFSSRDEPPTLDETLFDIRLFAMFLNYMKSQQAAPNLNFIKQARLLRLYNAPREVYVAQAVKMIWTYFSDCAPMPVTVSADVRKKLQEISLNPEAEVTLDKDSFSVAFGEVYNSVVPHFRNWIGTNEWREVIPFHRLAPPSFNVVLTSGTLRVLFNKYIKAQLDHDGDGSVAHAFHLWKFCIIANDFRDGKYSHASHLDGKKKKKEKGDDEEEKAEKTEDAEKDVNPEEYAKRLYKKYKHQVSLPYDGSIPYAVYIVRALDHAIEEFDKSALFARWVSLKQYQGVDYQAKVVHQTLTADGYVEPPTLAAAMTSSMLPFFLVLMKGSEHGLNLEFLVDAMKFHRRFEAFDKSAGGSSANSASTDSSRKDMLEEAKRMYAKYFESGDMYCDPKLVEEIHAAIKSGAKALSANTFRKCGAFIYQRSEHSWARQARATIVWTNKSYDNRSKAARAVEEEFSMKVLPEGTDLQIVPCVDDTLASSELMWDYADFAGKELNDAFAKYRAAYEEYFVAPVHKRKPLQEKVAAAYGGVANIITDLKPIHRVFEKEAAQRDRLSDSVFTFLSNSIIRAVAKKYYARWVVERNMKWKTVAWTPVPTVTFSDMTDAFGMSSVEAKVEEEALKGKSGFSRFLAKRQVKKQTVANVRTAPAKEYSNNSTTVFTTKGAGDLLAFGDLKGASELKAESGEGDSLHIPTLTETLSSSYLRKLFETLCLSTALSASEMTLWEALCLFYNKYSVKDDDKLIEAQDEMRSDIEKICEKYQNLFKKSAEVKERAKKLKIIFPQFFRPFEQELYASQHTEYEKLLRAKGWK